MKFNKLHFELYKDIFNYQNEIKAINRGFRLFLNKITNKLVIVNIFRNYEICFIFNSISEININNLRFLKIENFNKIINSIEQSNLNLENKNNKNMIEYTINTSKEFIKLTNRSSRTTLKDLNKLLGVTKCWKIFY